MSYTTKEHDKLVSCKDSADFKATKQDLLLSRKNEIAVAMQAQHTLYNDIDFDNSFDKLTLIYRGLSSMIESKLRSYGNFPDNDAMTHQLTGYCDGDVEHYAIDRDLEEQFGTKVLTDSESGMFVTMVQADSLDEVVDFLTERYRLLTFDIKDVRDDAIFTPTIKGLSNWNHAEDYVKANKLGHLVTNLINSF